MATLRTQGFQVGATERAPQIPANIGKVDVRGIYDAVRSGLANFEAARQAPASMLLADVEAKEKTAQAPMRTAVLAETVKQGPIRTQALAETAKQGPLQTRILEERVEEADYRNSPEYRDYQMRKLVTQTLPAGERAFESMIATFTPEQKERARLIKAGLEARAVTGAIRYQEITGADGRKYLVATDPTGVGAQIVGTGETFGTGVARPNAPQAMPPLATVQAQATPPPVEINPAAAQLVAPVDAATAEIPTPAQPAAATTPQPATPVAEQAPAVRPTPRTIFSSPTAAEMKQMETQAVEYEKNRQDALAKLPKAYGQIEELKKNTANIEKLIDEAIALTDETTAGIGALAKGLPRTEARTLAGLILRLSANIGFDKLQEMRQNSPTGGALGNVSDNEGRRLEAVLGTLDQYQKPEVLRKILADIKAMRKQALEQVENQFRRDADFFKIPEENYRALVQPQLPQVGGPKTDAEFTQQASAAAQPLPLPPAQPSAGRFKIVKTK